MTLSQILFIVFWLIGSAVCIITSKNIRDYKCYDNPIPYLCTGIILSILMSWALVMLNIMNNRFYIPTYIYHDCDAYSKVTFEDYDYDKDGNPMEEYDSGRFGHRETFRVYTCTICGKVRKVRLQ